MTTPTDKRYEGLIAKLRDPNRYASKDPVVKDAADWIEKLERDNLRLQHDRDARAREACTYEGRTGCSFAKSATGTIVGTVPAEESDEEFARQVEQMDKFDCHYDGDINACDKNCRELGECKRRTSGVKSHAYTRAPKDPSGGPHINPCHSCTDPQACGVNHHCAYERRKAPRSSTLACADDGALYKAMSDDRERYRLELLRANLLPDNWPAMSAAYMRAWQDGQKHLSRRSCRAPQACAAPECLCPAAAATEPRFFMDHGMIHDRVTGQHVHTQDDVEADATERLFKLLNDLTGVTSATRFGGQICKSHGQAVLVTHVSDGKACEDYLNASVDSTTKEKS